MRWIARAKIWIWKRTGNIDKIARFLQHGNYRVRHQAYRALVSVGASKDEMCRLFLDVFEAQNYEGDICRTAIRIFRSLIPQEELTNLFQSKLSDKFKRLPSWVPEKITEAEALRIFIENGSLQAFIWEGSQTRRDVEVIPGDQYNNWNTSEQGQYNDYIYTNYCRSFTE
jgi:hypothetical protein